MTWIAIGIGILTFFYLVGRLTQKPKSFLRVRTEVSEAFQPDWSKYEKKYLPNGNGPYTDLHTFEIFSTQATLAWTRGDETVFVRCISRFVGGKPFTNVYTLYSYNSGAKIWNAAPRGAAREIEREIKKVLNLK